MPGQRVAATAAAAAAAKGDRHRLHPERIYLVGDETKKENIIIVLIRFEEIILDHLSSTLHRHCHMFEAIFSIVRWLANLQT